MIVEGADAVEIITPTKIKKQIIVPGRCAKISFEPLERGYGTTLGNSLRRMLLSSLSGAAITAVRIDGVTHEFDVIKGVREDVLDILLSLKSVDIKMTEEKKHAILRLDIKGSATVVAGDLEVPAHVQVLNPELVLAHLNADGNLSMEIEVESGRGYLPSQEMSRDGRPVGTLLLDASFSPLRRVAMSVEHARIGQTTNYDKLILEIETNGAIRPDDALAKAARMLCDQLQPFVSFEESEEEIEELVEEERGNPLFDKPIDHLDLSVRSLNCLKSDNVFYIGDLAQRDEQQMLRTPNFGRKSLSEIKVVLDKVGLTLGMDIGSWVRPNLLETTQEEV
ncbi:MAG: DNA-directed RNA polymerase subunit alpha [Mariprofundales bacterium]